MWKELLLWNIHVSNVLLLLLGELDLVLTFPQVRLTPLSFNIFSKINILWEFLRYLLVVLQWLLRITIIMLSPLRILQKLCIILLLFLPNQVFIVFKQLLSFFFVLGLVIIVTWIIIPWLLPTLHPVRIFILQQWRSNHSLSVVLSLSYCLGVCRVVDLLLNSSIARITTLPSSGLTSTMLQFTIAWNYRHYVSTLWFWPVHISRACSRFGYELDHVVVLWRNGITW